MSTVKCKTCGGTIEYEQGVTSVVCCSCGATQPLFEADTVQETVSAAASLLERVYLFLEDGKWQDADIYCEKVLDIDSKNAEAYLCKLMAELQVKTRVQLADCAEPFDNRENYAKVIRFGDETLESEVRGYISHIKERNENERLLNSRKAEERRAAAKKKRKKAWTAIAITASIVCACIAFAFVLTKVIIPNNKYNEAVALVNDGKIIDAYDNLIAMNGYKDSAAKAREIFYRYEMEKLKIAEVGDEVYFGAYEQDNETYNGKENVEWIVLAKEDGKALLVSKYALDYQKYDYYEKNIEWEKCSLRSWLNGEFYNNAFDADERAGIAISKVKADRNPKHINISGGIATTDKVFLLSIVEVEKYFTSESQLQCLVTQYAKKQAPALALIYSDTCWWWLRSPGRNYELVSGVNSDGSIDYDGSEISTKISSDISSDTHLLYTAGFVRPAMWIDLSE